jgi:outer membrane lipoprotein
MMKQIPVIILVLTTFAGCAHVISPDVRWQVNTGITFQELRKNPDAFKGEIVLLGGVIVSTRNLGKGTLLEVYQTKLDAMGEPIDLDNSEGRFLAVFDEFLDGEIYSKGRKVTIAGVVQGERIGEVGEVPYRYPYLEIREIHLWKKEPEYPYYPYGPSPPPYWGYGYPWGRPYYRGPLSPHGPYWY